MFASATDIAQEEDFSKIIPIRLFFRFLGMRFTNDDEWASAKNITHR
jgi:hypothetical protein